MRAQEWVDRRAGMVTCGTQIQYQESPRRNEYLGDRVPAIGGDGSVSAATSIEYGNSRGGQESGWLCEDDPDRMSDVWNTTQEEDEDLTKLLNYMDRIEQIEEENNRSEEEVLPADLEEVWETDTFLTEDWKCLHVEDTDSIDTMIQLYLYPGGSDRDHGEEEECGRKRAMERSGSTSWSGEADLYLEEQSTMSAPSSDEESLDDWMLCELMKDVESLQEELEVTRKENCEEIEWNNETTIKPREDVTECNGQEEDLFGVWRNIENCVLLNS